MSDERGEETPAFAHHTFEVAGNGATVLCRSTETVEALLGHGCLVEVRVDAQRRMYRVRAEPLRAVGEWLEPYRLLWESRLDDLERHLDTME